MSLYNCQDTFYYILDNLEYPDLLKVRGLNHEIKSLYSENRFKQLVKQKRLSYKIFQISQLITKFGYYYFSVYKGDINNPNAYHLDIHRNTDIKFSWPIKSKHVEYIIYWPPNEQQYPNKKELRKFLQPIFQSNNFALHVDVEHIPANHVNFIIADSIKYKSTIRLPEDYGRYYFENGPEKSPKIHPMIRSYLSYDKYKNTITINPHKRKIEYYRIDYLVYLIILVLLLILLGCKISF